MNTILTFFSYSSEFQIVSNIEYKLIIRATTSFLIEKLTRLDFAKNNFSNFTKLFKLLGVL